ncbi:MAG: Sec-independent protein secretion pathway component [Streptomycetaceae bacterium]|nr:MAG: Sec-independent protein secretion pathway component [Streptomycetaceae bacterium]
MLFNIGPGEFLGLAIIAMILVGPERLPKVAVEAAKILKKLRDLAHVATAELKENLGPGFENLEPQDLHPKTFIKKQLADLMEDKPVTTPKNLHAQIDPDLL